jgi:hypothetical protein
MPHPTQTPKSSLKHAGTIGRRPRCSILLTTPLVLASLLAPTSAAAQGTATWGALMGQVQSRQLHSHDDDTDTRTDVVLGAFVDVATPVSWLHIMLEASFARLGGDYAVETTGGPTTQSARVDYLSFTLLPTGRMDFGRVGLYGSVGFARESGLDIRSTAELAGLFTDPATQVLALIAAAGVEVSVARGWSARLEVREHNQVSPAFRPTSGEIRHRSREIVFKVGMRPGG